MKEAQHFLTEKEYQKYQALRSYLKDLGSVAVAFSGGVDSAFLLAVAKKVLKGNAVAVTAVANTFPHRETDEADAFCRSREIRQISFPFDPLQIDGFAKNPPNRCYLCKKFFLQEILAIAKKEHLSAVVEGSNTDDETDYRPGMAAITELGIKSPLRACHFSKAEIRNCSKWLSLPTWEKPSFACLATRFACGERITNEKLSMVEKGEELLFSLGFSQVRVRTDGVTARIEVLPSQLQKVLDASTRKKIISSFKNYGFTYISLDLQGYRMGSMNETNPSQIQDYRTLEPLVQE